MCARVTRRLKSGEAVFRVHAYKSGVFVGEAFLQVATHAGKLGTPPDQVVAVRAAGMRAALEGRATRSEVLSIHC